MTKLEVVRVATLTLPIEEIVNWLFAPTVNNPFGEVVPIPILPLLSIIILSCPPVTS